MEVNIALASGHYILKRHRTGFHLPEPQTVLGIDLMRENIFC